MSFEILREMESFTQNMFNGIIGFQEKNHPAWKNDHNFQERIKNIPLHYLMFSNADRDPKTHGPTIAHYYPLQFEMAKIADYIKQVAALSSQNISVYDVHARNGFIGSLLAQELIDAKIKITGLQNPDEKPNQIESFYDEKNYEMKQATLSDIDTDVDVVFSSWMPAGMDITDDIIAKNPKLIVYVLTEHTNEFSGDRQTGTDKSFGEKLPEQYKLLEEWSVTRTKDLLHEIWPDLTGNLEEVRIVRIYANEGFHDISSSLKEVDSTGYDWEKDLQMADTAHRAKEEMKNRGFPAQF